MKPFAAKAPKNANAEITTADYNSEINLKSNSKKDTTAAEKNNLFQFSSTQNNFVLEIRFTSVDGFEKRDVLKALKEAFDKTKQSK